MKSSKTERNPVTSLAYPWTRKHWHTSAGLMARIRATLAILNGKTGELCGLCGRPVEIVWWSDEALWRELTGWTDGSGIAWIRCYDDLAREHGRYLRWQVWPL